MISIFTEAAHALFYTTGGACCGFFLAALCHAAGNDSDDRLLPLAPGPPEWNRMNSDGTATASHARWDIN